MPGRTEEITGLSLFWFLARSRPSISNENKRAEKNQSTREALNSLCAGPFSVVDQQTGGRLSADSMTTASMSYDDDDDWNDNLSDDDDDDDDDVAEDDSGSLAGVDFISER